MCATSSRDDLGLAREYGGLIANPFAHIVRSYMPFFAHIVRSYMRCVAVPGAYANPRRCVALASMVSTEPWSYQSPSTMRWAGRPSMSKVWMAGRWV